MTNERHHRVIRENWRFSINILIAYRGDSISRTENIDPVHILRTEHDLLTSRESHYYNFF